MLRRRLACALAALLVLAAACEAPAPKPEDAARAYADAWQRASFGAMYDLLAPEAQKRIARDAFVGRYARIAEEMSLSGVDVETGVAVAEQDASHKPLEGRMDVPLTVRYRTTRVDPFTRGVTLVLVRQQDKSWRIDWTPEAILPGLSGDRLVRMTRLVPTRGRIVARDGTELATFGDGFEVGVVPGQIQDEAAMLRSLAPLLGMTEAQIKSKYASGQPDWYMPVRVMPPSTPADARQKLGLIEGVQLRPMRVRTYPQGTLAAHVIGYVGVVTADELVKLAPKGYADGDLVGKTGLELTLEDVLAGTFGWRLAIVEADGTQASILAERQPEQGQDVQLSLDVGVQRAAEAALVGEPKSAVVVEDPSSGEILAIASHPTFDPNVFAGQDAAAAAKYVGDPARPLFNRATNGQYPTGSSFKMITSLAALREGVLQPTEKVPCPAVWTGYGPTFKQLNHETGDLGPIDLHTALARSCNTFYYELGKRLNDKDPHLLPDTAKSFGLGKATDVEYVYEASGFVPTPEQPVPTAATDRVWLPGDATNLAIGQGQLLATPLQMANYIAAVLNGGTLLKPRLVTSILRRDGAVAQTFERAELGRADARAQDYAPVRDGMRGVVADRDGTAYFPFLGFSVPVLGKSGTAETTAGRPDGWFVAGAPFGSPTIAVAALAEEVVERPGTFASVNAAAIARKALAAALHVAP
ncbi:MAG TPA: penicillin-binding transpeptidase domain-containing protein [Candidatus Dormibacteraeota bacterium]|nr:penicillin-binding transpeptidase domain-containing protein [Candidatus Dormibacteraeota bacterium]